MDSLARYAYGRIEDLNAMPTAIAGLLSTPIPEKLWHYTSIEAFQKIVLSKRVYATDPRYLNDREEFIHARKIVGQILEESPDLDASGFLYKQFLSKAALLGFDSGPLADVQVFIACFSAAEDQLGQWRGYSHGSCGVSLGFDLSSFRPPPDSDTLVCFAPCVYDPAEKRELLLDALHHVKDEIAGYRERIFKLACEKDPHNASAPDKEDVVKAFLDANSHLRAPVSDLAVAATKTRVACLRMAALLKNSAFEEENEWRLVLPTLLTQQEAMKNPPQYRVGKTALIPYIAHPFSADIPFPLADVILGPGSDDNSVFAAERFLKSQNLNIKPRLSAVPYRAS
jgi:Protein of unknown function (DUF2971)